MSTPKTFQDVSWGDLCSSLVNTSTSKQLLSRNLTSEEALVAQAVLEHVVLAFLHLSVAVLAQDYYLGTLPRDIEAARLPMQS